MVRFVQFWQMRSLDDSGVGGMMTVLPAGGVAGGDCGDSLLVCASSDVNDVVSDDHRCDVGVDEDDNAGDEDAGVCGKGDDDFSWPAWVRGLVF